MKKVAKHKPLSKEQREEAEWLKGLAPDERTTVPRELDARPERRIVSLDEPIGGKKERKEGGDGTTRHEVIGSDVPLPAPSPARVNKDVPDFNEETGLIHREPQMREFRDGALVSAESKPDLSHEARFEAVSMATELLEALGKYSAYPSQALPQAEIEVTREDAEALQVDERLLASLPALRELHRQLCQPWRRLLLHWFTEHALAKLEARQRPLRDKRRLDGERVNLLPERRPGSGEQVIEALRRLYATEQRSEGEEETEADEKAPPVPIGDVPPGLTPEILDFLAAMVNRNIGGRNGGYTPATALGLAEKWSQEPDAFAAALASVKEKGRQKADRRERSKKKRAAGTHSKKPAG